MSNLELFGWNEFFAAQLAAGQAGGAPARVCTEHGDRYRVAAESGEQWARLTGALRATGSPLPAVGDWVLVTAPAGGGIATIERVLARRSALSRQRAGTRTGQQVIAANLDVVFIVTALDGDFSARRIERYATAVWESGARPVVVLNKLDLAAGLAARLEEAGRAAPGAPVLTTSAASGEGLDTLRAHLPAGATAVLIGSSGVGKSTLVNRLLGHDALRTGAVRESDGRGRHTTSARTLLRLPGGGLVIDGPGMRELQLWEGEEGRERAFTDITALAASCRFADCRHRDEPGCAVSEAVAAGLLEAGRLASWHKLGRELRHQQARTDLAARLAENRRWRAIHRAQRRFLKDRQGS